METAIGVFASRELGQDAVRKLLEQNVPHESIVFLTRSESEGEAICKQIGAAVGAFLGMATGMSAGVGIAALLAFPATWHMFALGFGSAALLGLSGAGLGAFIGKTVACHSGEPRPAIESKRAADSAFLGEILKEWHSLIVVHTDGKETAQVASQILDPLGLAIQGRKSLQLHSASATARTFPA